MTRLLPFHPIYGGRWFLRRATYSTAKVDYIFAPTRAKLRHFANISGKCYDFEHNIIIEHTGIKPYKKDSLMNLRIIDCFGVLEFSVVESGNLFPINFLSWYFWNLVIGNETAKSLIWKHLLVLNWILWLIKHL